MAYKQVPKGYFKAEHPLPHNMRNRFELTIDDTVDKNCTYIPLILNDEGLVNADTVNVNPRHGSFAESNNPYCYHDSIIPKMMVNLKMMMTKGAIETDKMRHIIVNWAPVYVSFLNRLEAQDSKTAVQIEDIMELQHETVGKSVYPIWGGTKMAGADVLVGIHANATTALMGMTTNANLERVIWDKELFFDAMQYYTNAPMLQKVVGSIHKVVLNRDRMYQYFSGNFTHPMVKRINDYTFCGLLFYAPKTSDVEQLVIAGDSTAISHVNVSTHIRYDEWNSEFDQTTS